MSLVITPNGAGAITFSDPSAGFSGSAAKYVLRYGLPGAKRYGRQEHRGLVGAGASVTRFPFHSRAFRNMLVAYVAASQATCVSNYEADHAAMANVIGGNSVSIFGTPFGALELDEFEWDGRGPKFTSQNAMYMLRCRLSFIQLRDE